MKHTPVCNSLPIGTSYVCWLLNASRAPVRRCFSRQKFACQPPCCVVTWLWVQVNPYRPQLIGTCVLFPNRCISECFQGDPLWPPHRRIAGDETAQLSSHQPDGDPILRWPWRVLPAFVKTWTQAIRQHRQLEAIYQNLPKISQVERSTKKPKPIRKGFHLTYLLTPTD